MRYKADITAGALKLPESRIIADLLIHRISAEAWSDAIIIKNVLQSRNPETARRIARLIRSRLELMGSDIWKMVRDGNNRIAIHATLAAAVKHSALLGDFLDLIVREQNRLFMPALSKPLWENYLAGCRGRDPEMPQWNESTQRRLRSSVFQILAQAGYLENTRNLKLQPVQIAPPVIGYLQAHNEQYVLKCLQVSP
jgi:hypothetical protein